ncbi:MAG TPA: hypothetical protein VKX41_13165 [Alloacidobacterium sp.]|jgi:DNA repair ATPase RecN|nr:hypothetical protein [Alloacidobacterium sp.]
MGPSLQALEDQYMLLSQNLSMILAACPTQTERDQVMTQYVTARRNYWNSIQKVFHDDDPKVVVLVQEMQTEQKKIQDATNHLNNIAKVIDIITDAVNVGSTLASIV